MSLPSSIVQTATASTRFGNTKLRTYDIGRGFVQLFIAGLIASIFYYYLNSINTKTNSITDNPLSTVLLHPSPEARTVGSLLVLIFIYTTLAIIWNTIELKKEQNQFNIIREILSSTPDNYLESMLRAKLANVQSNSLLAQAIQAIWDARHLQSPDLEAISSSLDALEDKRNGTGIGVSNRLMLISLLGTILGLAQVISTLDPKIKNASITGDVQSIFDNLQNTLMQMGTAFSSTAWGILLSTLLSWITSGASAARQEYAAKIHYFVVSELAPRIYTTSPAAAIDNLRDAILQGQQLIKHAESTITKSITQQDLLLDRLVTAHKSIETETKSFITKVENVFINNANQFEKKLTDVGNYVVDGAKAQIEAAVRLDDLLVKSTIELSDAAKNLSVASTVIQSLNSTAQQMNIDLKNIAPQLSNLLISQVDALTKSGDAMTAIATQQAQIWNGRITQQETLFKKSLEDLQDTTSEIRALVGTVQPRLPSSAELDKLRDSIERIAKIIDTFGGERTSNKESTLTSNIISPAQWKQVMSESLEPLTRQLNSGTLAQAGNNDVRIINELTTTNQQLQVLTLEIHNLVRALSNVSYPASNAATTFTQPDEWIEPEPPPSLLKKVFGRFRK